MEREVVYGILTNDVSAAGAAVDCSVFEGHGAASGLHAGAVRCHSPAADRRLSLRAYLGKRARRQLRRSGKHLAGSACISGLSGRTDFHYLGGAALFERIAV